MPWLLLAPLLCADPSAHAVFSTDPDVPVAAAAIPPLESSRGSQMIYGRALATLVSRHNGTGTRQPALTVLRSMLTDADRLEANFENAAANRLRVEVIRAYDEALRTDQGLVDLAGRASVALAASALGAGESAASRAVAANALRRFPNAKIDRRLYNPTVQKLFGEARQTIDAQPTVALSVSSTVPGELYADGAALGPIDQTTTVRLPRGHYRIWIQSPNGTSLAHAVDLNDQTAPEELAIDAVAESALVTRNDRLFLPCAEDHCAPLLERFAVSYGLAGAVALTRSGDVYTALWVGARGEDDTLSFSAASSHRSFSPLLLLPFGVGQLADDRPIAGALYGAVQAGLLAWNIKATLDNDGKSSHRRNEELAARQNLSAALFYSSMALSIAEALIVWASAD